MVQDKLWDEIESILAKEKPSKTIGSPIVPYRKVLDGILYVLRTGCQWKCYPKNMDQVQHVIGAYRNGMV